MRSWEISFINVYAIALLTILLLQRLDEKNVVRINRFDEILRAIDALQFSDKHGVATPADWREGKDAIIPPSVSDEDAKARFPQGFTTLRPYLRTVEID